MDIFCTDLDNTIIYSYKHDIGSDKKNVELYQGREISFITKATYELLKKVSEQYLIVPTTTRTEEQYKRIDLGIGTFQYALVCNGGLLLVNGERDRKWYEESIKLAEPSSLEIRKALEYLNSDKRRKFELRFIENLFVFTKCNEPENVVVDLKKYLSSDLVDVFSNGEKVYVVPVNLSKGNAIKRFREYLKPKYMIAAGDSEFDISMVQEADAGLVPYQFKEQFGINNDICEMGKDRLFSEALLEKCLEIKAEHR